MLRDKEKVKIIKRKIKKKIIKTKGLISPNQIDEPISEYI